MSSEDEHVAKHVCANCRQRKKKCDKRVPYCTQCKQLRVKCTYGDVETNNFASQLRSLQSRMNRIETIIASQQLSKSATHAILEERGQVTPPDEFTQEPVSWKLFLETQNPQDLDRIVTQHVVQFLQSTGRDSHDTYICYFANVHKWLPVIPQKVFYEKLTNFPAIPSASFSLQVLCIHLLIMIPHNEAAKLEQQMLHQNARSLYFFLQSISVGSMELVQSGLILATYEHASGLLEEAYSSIGTSARMAYSIGLRDEAPHGWMNDEDQLNRAQANNLWWAIAIRDRCINLEDQMRRRPLATENPSPNDSLPVDIDMMINLSPTQTPTPHCLSDFSTEQLSMDSLGREAQACHLLSQALDVSRSPNSRKDSPEVLEMEMKMQKFLSTLMDKTTGTWGTFCGATSLIISAFYILHRNQYPTMHNNNTGNDYLKQADKAGLVLRAMTRIVIDIAHAFNENFANFNMAAISPSYPFIVYKAAMEHMLSNEIGSQKWMDDFLALRKCCWFFSHRWTIAVHYLNTIEQTASALGIGPLPSFGEFVVPKGSLSGLC